MSVQALGWVFDHSPAQGTDRLVLLSIANHAGKDPESDAWEAWPGTETIQRESGLDRHRTVRDSLGRLVEAGALERIVNGAPDERVRKDRRSNLYRILLTNGRTCGDPRCGWCGGTRDDQTGGRASVDGRTRDVATGGRDASTKPSLNRQEPSVEPRAADPDLLLEVEDAPVVDLFEEFWRSYPRKVAKPEARKAWDAKVSKHDGLPATVLAALGRWADYWKSRGDERFIPHPSTWLRREGWNDPPPAQVRTQTKGPRWAPSEEEERAQRAVPAGRIVDL